MNGGYIKLFRQIREWEFYGIPSAMMLWIHLLITANWEDGSFRGEPVPRGSLVTSIDHLATYTGLSKSTVRRWLEEFEKARMIEKRATHRWTHIKILNDSTFQGIGEGDPGTVMNTQVNTEVNTIMNTPVNTNKRNKENKKKENSPLNPPKGRRGSRGSGRDEGIVIETPAWYKRQQAAHAAGEEYIRSGSDDRPFDEDPEDTETLIAEIEEMKRRMLETS